jgi:hypothetical protein
MLSIQPITEKSTISFVQCKSSASTEVKVMRHSCIWNLINAHFSIFFVIQNIIIIFLHFVHSVYHTKKMIKNKGKAIYMPKHDMTKTFWKQALALQESWTRWQCKTPHSHTILNFVSCIYLFIYGLLNDLVNSDYTALNDRINELRIWKGYRKKQS